MLPKPRLSPHHPVSRWKVHVKNRLHDRWQGALILESPPLWVFPLPLSPVAALQWVAHQGRSPYPPTCSDPPTDQLSSQNWSVRMQNILVRVFLPSWVPKKQEACSFHHDLIVIIYPSRVGKAAIPDHCTLRFSLNKYLPALAVHSSPTKPNPSKPLSLLTERTQIQNPYAFILAASSVLLSHKL